MQPPPRVSTASLIAEGFAAVVKPPFRGLIALSVLITITSDSFGTDVSNAALALALILLFASIYIQIALTLAAGRTEVEPSVDLWLRGALRRRCLWRFVGASVLALLALLVGALLLGIGLFLVGALIGMAQTAAVIERRAPMDAITRSAQLSKGSRWAIGSVFAVLVLAPTAATQIGAAQGWPSSLGPGWYALLVVAEICSSAGVVALTRAFVALGGGSTPAPSALAPAPRTVSR